MNALRRLEEFIFKLSTTQNNYHQVDLTIGLKYKIGLDNQNIKNKPGDNKLITNSASFVAKDYNNKVS